MQSKIERLFSNRALVILIICCLGIIIYSNTFNSPFNFDDYLVVVNNPNIKNLSDLRAIFSPWPPRFIAYLSFAVNYYFSQLEVFGYHLVNTIIHLWSSIIVWLFTLAVFSTPVMKKQEVAGHKYMISFFAGLIFLVHPIQTQAITYIVHRTASLATLFYMISLYFYIKSRLFKPQTQESDTGRVYYFSSLVTAVMAMFTKEITITLPLMIILIEYCFFKEEKKLPWRRIIPFLGMLLIIPLTLLTAKLINSIGMENLFRHPPDISPLNYLLTEFKVILTYIRLVFLPLNQNLDYDYPVAKSLLELPVLSSLLFIIIVLILAIRGFSKYRIISFSIFFFFLTLMPESSIMPIQDVIFEHRLYLPMAGFSIFISCLLYYLIGRKNILVMLLISVLAVNWYAVSTYARNFDWKDGITLWNDVIRKSPRKAGPYVSRGIIFIANDKYDKAMSDFKQALDIDYNYPQARNGLGVVYCKRGEFDKGINQFSIALEIDPYYLEARCNRGAAYLSKKEYALAEEDFKRVLNMNNSYFDAYKNLGSLYSMTDRFEDAIIQYKNILRLDPWFLEGYSKIITIYSNMGDSKKVIEYCLKSLKVYPEYIAAYINLGVAYGSLGDFESVKKYSKIAIMLDKNSALAHYNLSVAYYYTKQYNLALIHCDEALRLKYNVNPDFLKALKPLRK